MVRSNVFLNTPSCAIIHGYVTRNPIENITLGLRHNALRICPCNANKVARVIPQPGQGMWKMSFEGQTTKEACPTLNHAITIHRQTAKYAIAEKIYKFLVEIELQFVVVNLLGSAGNIEPVDNSPNTQTTTS